MQITEIMYKYSSNAKIVLVHDINAPLTRENPTPRDVFRKYCNCQALYIGDNYPLGNTFHHSSGNSSSQIDYILCLKSDALTIIRDISILPGDPLNTSTHVSVACHIPKIAELILCEHTSGSRKKIRGRGRGVGVG